MSFENELVHTTRIEEGANEAIQEQREMAANALELANYVVTRYAQVDDGREIIIQTDEVGTHIELPPLPENMSSEPRMNYYLSGSLATTLLAHADGYTELDETEMPRLVDRRSVQISPKAREIFTSFARPIGDLDYVRTDNYKARLDQANALYRSGEDNTAYRAARAKILTKGGGGPSYEEIPPNGRKALKQAKGQVMVFCDPVESYGAKRVARITVEDQDYYIARPDTILAYKVLHILQGYEQKPERFNQDFPKLLEALLETYPTEDLLSITDTVLTDYEEAMRGLHDQWEKEKDTPAPYEPKLPGMIQTVLAHPELDPSIRSVLETLQQAKQS